VDLFFAHCHAMAGASPAQVDRVLRQTLGLAMGVFEMLDLAGLDIGWRQRAERGLTAPANRDPSKRYSSLMDKLCEKG
jgi:3-hydroxyacyl-CoA dehydrogenase